MRRAALGQEAAGQRRTASPGIALLAPGAILAQLPVAVVVLGAGDRFVFANVAAEQFFVASAALLAGMSLTDFVPRESTLLKMIAEVRSRGVTMAAHALTLESPRLARRGVNAQVAPLAEIEGAVVIGLEETEVARDLDAGARWAPAAQGVAGMAAVLAHEVKNPLSGIRGAAQLLEATSGPGDRELAILIRDEADRIRALIERMEMFGRERVARAAVNIHRVLEHVRRLAQNGFAQHIRLVEAYDPSLPPAFGNRDQLVQVMLNLVKNAAEAITAGGQPGGEIVLSTAFRQGVWLAGEGAAERRHLPLVVAVRDNGPGIPAALRPRLFEPFVSGREGGSGLGLALVAKIVSEHGGLIDVESRTGRTEFRLHLPVLADAEADETQNQDARSPDACPGQANFG
ncbi:MAG: two-component system sensor histidine kinase NtrB [Acetobacteraceae bacterium]